MSRAVTSIRRSPSSLARTIDARSGTARHVGAPYGCVGQMHEWVKRQVICGMTTLVVAAIESGPDANDDNVLLELVEATAANLATYVRKHKTCGPLSNDAAYDLTAMKVAVRWRTAGAADAER